MIILKKAKVWFYRTKLLKLMTMYILILKKSSLENEEVLVG